MTDYITPLEFEQRDLHKQVGKDLIVWYKDDPIESVRRYQKGADSHYDLYFDDGSDSGHVACVGTYERCLEVQDATDKAALRAEIRVRLLNALDAVPDDDLIRTLMNVRQFGI